MQWKVCLPFSHDDNEIWEFHILYFFVLPCFHHNLYVLLVCMRVCTPWKLFSSFCVYHFLSTINSHFSIRALWLVCCFLCSPYLVCFFIIYIPTKLANIKQDKPDFLHHFSTPVTLSSLLSELFTELKRRCVCSVARLHCLFKMYTDYITKNDMANNMGKVEKLREIFGAMYVDGKNLHIKFAQNYSWKMFEPRTEEKTCFV